MANPLSIWLAIAIVTGICIRGAIILRRRYLRTRRADDAEDTTTFEKDVEWQLQHELSEAVNSATNTPPNEMLETRPLLPPSPPRVAFTNDHLTAGSWHDFKAYSAAELPRVELVHQPQPSQDGLGMNGGRFEQPLYVNPKQFHRILKRRMTRQLIEEYFRLTRASDAEDKIEPMISRGRRPRGSDGQFLTAEQMERMASEGVVVA